jgi:hypothetical protein
MLDHSDLFRSTTYDHWYNGCYDLGRLKDVDEAVWER